MNTRKLITFIPLILVITANIALFGLSSIKTLHFICATAVGNLIYGLVLSLVSFSMLSAPNHIRLYLLLAVIVILVVVLLYRVNKRRHKQESDYIY